MTNVAFEIAALANANGDCEILSVECEPTDEVDDGTLEACEVDTGSWEFRFIVPGDFDGSETVFERFARYRLSPATVCRACREAMEASTSLSHG
ncbi:MAG TPA: hypothetical protein VFB13_01535 [Reyranella sp.]|nr:hypothetical protein [Reyranella sp.]